MRSLAEIKPHLRNKHGTDDTFCDWQHTLKYYCPRNNRWQDWEDGDTPEQSPTLGTALQDCIGHDCMSACKRHGNRQ